eukprot:EG_transcript_35882
METGVVDWFHWWNGWQRAVVFRLFVRHVRVRLCGNTCARFGTEQQKAAAMQLDKAKSRKCTLWTTRVGREGHVAGTQGEHQIRADCPLATLGLYNNGSGGQRQFTAAASRQPSLAGGGARGKRYWRGYGSERREAR